MREIININVLTRKSTLVLVFIIFYTGLFGQDSVLNNKISISFKNKPLYQALSKISEKVGYYFSYDADEIHGAKEVTLKINDEKLESVLIALLNDSIFKFKVVEKQIVIFKPKISLYVASLNKKDTLPYMRVEGRIVDIDSKEPLPFANIYIVEKNAGTVSNMEGEFVLKILKSDFDKQLGISYLGYKNHKVLIESLSEKNNLFHLHKDYIPIQEVIIRHAEPLNLMRLAKKNISQNYSSRPVLLTSFYRESVKKDDDYVSVSEAILNVYKSAYKNISERDKIKVFKSRKSADHNMDTVAFKLKAGLNTSLLLDLVKNPTEFLIEDYFQYYDYQLSDIVIFDKDPVYVVDFKQKEEVQELLYKGEIYIDVNTFAIRMIKFSLNPDRVKRNPNNLVVKRSSKIKVKTLSAEYLTSYRKIGNTHYLNHVRCELSFKVRNKKQFFSSTYNALLEMAVNDIDTTDIQKFKNREADKPTKIFTEQINEYDESFWGKHNYIKPDEPLKIALRRISLSLQKVELAKDKNKINSKGIVRDTQ